MSTYGGSHRVLSDDGGSHCYACGIAADDSASARDAMAALPCKPGGWDHPPYVLGWDGDTLLVETCAAHPYDAACAYDPAILAALA